MAIEISQSTGHILSFFNPLWCQLWHTVHTPASTYTSDPTEFYAERICDVSILAVVLVVHAPFADRSAGLLFVTCDAAVPLSSLCR